MSPAAAGQAPVAASSASRDIYGITHVRAASTGDAFYLNGWVHARDRLFQMDVYRRSAEGTLAELLGKGALPSDAEARTIGLARAAQASWNAASADLRQTLQAYADGVNAYATSHRLPPEYLALGLTGFTPWTPVDSLAVGKGVSFELSFDLGDIDRTTRCRRMSRHSVNSAASRCSART